MANIPTSMEPPSDPTGAPSHFLSPKIKDDRKWCVAWNRYTHSQAKLGLGSNIFRMGFEQDAINQAYSEARQPVDKLKPILGIKKKTKDNPNGINYKVLSWENLGVMPKFINLLVGRLMGQNNDVGVFAIDKHAQDEKRRKKTSLQEYVVNKDFLNQVAASTGIPFEGPDHDASIPEPQNMGEIDLYMNMFYKEHYCLVLQDMIALLNDQDNYQEILKDVAFDLPVKGVAITKAYRVGKRIKRRHCQKERMIASSSKKDNYDDVEYIGEYWDITIGQLKEIAGRQFNEDEYRKIAEQVGKQNFNGIDPAKYFTDNMCYPWDKTKITVQDLIWFSPDEEIYVTSKTRYGNVVVEEKDYAWWDNLRKKGVNEDEFNRRNTSQVSVQNVNNQYQSMWIVNTDFVFNFGKSKDMLKNESDIGKIIGPFCIHSLRGGSIVERLIPVIDNIQLNWLQYQHHAAKSRPSGPSIEFSALQDVGIEGPNGKKMTPKQILELYFDTGILLWRRKGVTGDNTNFQPVQEMINGLSPACMQHLQNVLAGIDLLRGLIGLNEMTDASTPNSEMGKAVAKMAAGGTQDALKYLHYSFDQVNIGTQLRTVMMISSMAATGMAPDYTEVIGRDNMAFLALMSDIGAHEYGIGLQKQATEEMRMRLMQYCAEGIAAKPPTLYPEECFEIENEPNIYRAIQLLKTYRQQKIKQAQADQATMYQQEQEKNINSANATEAAKQQTIQVQSQLSQQDKQQDIAGQMALQRQHTVDEAFLLAIKGKQTMNEVLTKAEKDHLTKLATASIQGEYALAVAKEKPTPKAPTK